MHISHYKNIWEGFAKEHPYTEPTNLAPAQGPEPCSPEVKAFLDEVADASDEKLTELVQG